MQNDQEQFWKLVAACLSKILGYGSTQAFSQTQKYRRAIEAECKRRRVLNIILHESPLQVACDIAGEDADELDEPDYEALVAKPVRQTTSTPASQTRIRTGPTAKSRVARSQELAPTGTEGTGSRKPKARKAGAKRSGTTARVSMAAKKKPATKKPTSKTAVRSTIAKPSDKPAARKPTSRTKLR